MANTGLLFLITFINYFILPKKFHNNCTNFLNSMSQMSPKEVKGASNFYIPIFSSFNSSHAPLVLWFMDTHSRGCMGVDDSYGCIEKSQ